MKNICFVMTTPFVVGGEQRVVSVISSLLQENGYNVTILCKYKSPINYNLYNLNKDVKIEFMRDRTIGEKIQRAISLLLIKINNKTGIFKNKVNVLQKIVCDQSSRKIIKEKIEKGNYDIIIGVAGYFSLLVASIKCNDNIRKIGWQHSSFDAYFNNKGRYYWNQKELFKKLIPKLDKYIVLTNYDRKRIKDEWNIESTTIYNPRSFSTKEKSKLNKKQFLAAGRFTYAKGFDMLIKSFKIFSEKNKEWNLQIVGDGEEKEKLVKLIEENKLQNRVILHPFTNDIKKYFRESSALLMPSRWEGMPMIMLESLTMGVPVIAYDIPVVKEVIDNKNDGMIVEQGNIEEYARALEIFISDEENIKEMGIKAKEKSEQFSYEKVLKDWKKLLSNMEK